MNFAQRIDFNSLMEPVALRLLGEPAQKHGHEWRYGNRGSLSIDLAAISCDALSGCTLWRAIQFVHPPVADIATAAEKIRAHLWADRVRGRTVQAAGLPRPPTPSSSIHRNSEHDPGCGRPLRRT